MRTQIKILPAPNNLMEYVSGIFNWPVKEPEWYWEFNISYPNENLMIDYFHELHRNPIRYLSAYEDAQIEQGIQLMMFPGASDYHRVLTFKQLDIEKRIKAILSIKCFYEQIYCARCTPVSTFLNRSDLNPLNNSCFMWWDMSPLFGSSEIRIIEACCEVIEFCLYLPNLACQEGALHGLGHLNNVDGFESISVEIIERFMGSSNENKDELMSYALAAQQGMVQ